MRYPKIWGTGNPGVGRGQLNQLNGGRFQTKTAPGAVSSAQGKFSAIHLDQGESPRWVSTGYNTYGSATDGQPANPKVSWAPASGKGWARRNLSHLSLLLGPPVHPAIFRVFPAGNTRYGLGVTLSGFGDEPGFSHYTVSKYRFSGEQPFASEPDLNRYPYYQADLPLPDSEPDPTPVDAGGRNYPEIFVDSAVMYSAEDGPIVPWLLLTYPRASGEVRPPAGATAGGIYRQQPAYRIQSVPFTGFEVGAIVDFDISDVVALDDNIDYVIPAITQTLPGIFVSSIAELGALPALITSFDTGVSWVGRDIVTPPNDCFPTIDPTLFVYDAEGDFTFPNLDFTDDTPWHRREMFVNQSEIANLYIAARFQLLALSASRVMIVAFVVRAADQSAYVFSEYDLVEGEVISQFEVLFTDFPTQPEPYDPPNQDGFPMVHPVLLGQDSWAMQLGISRPFITDSTPEAADPKQWWEFKTLVTWDRGDTYTEVVLPDGAGRLGPVVGHALPYEDPPVFPKVYFTRRIEVDGVDVRRELWVTTDGFDTYRKVGVISTAGNLLWWNDFSHATLLGANDPCVPWRCDPRITPPDWWLDGLI